MPLPPAIHRLHRRRRRTAKPPEDDIEVLDEVVDLQETGDPAAGWYGKGYPERVRILALPTARTTRKGGFELHNRPPLPRRPSTIRRRAARG